MTDEEHRHRCEVREWLRHSAINGKAWLKDVLRDIEARRGRRAALRIRDDISQQWRLGNRGQPGDWREEPEE